MNKCPICGYPATEGICKNCKKTIISPAEAMRYASFNKPKKSKWKARKPSFKG